MWHQRTWPKNPWSDSAHVMQLLRLLNCIIFLRSCIMGFYLVFESRCALAISCACLLLTLALWNNISCSSDDALKSTMLLFDSEIICVITTLYVTRSRAFVLCRSGAYQNGRRNAKWEKAYSFFFQNNKFWIVRKNLESTSWRFEIAKQWSILILKPISHITTKQS